MANNESKTLKSNTLEKWRQDTNASSHHLGDVGQLDSRLTDKIYTYTGDASKYHYDVYDADTASKNIRFELSPEENTDAILTIIMTGNPTIPASFVASVTVFQGSSGSETFTGNIIYINKNKIAVQNTTGSFNPAVVLKYSTDTIPASKLVRTVSESYKKGYVTATVAGSIVTQTQVQTGFHVPNIGLRVVLTGTPSIPASFSEGATVTQTGGFSGTLYKATTTELLFKTFTGTFNVGQNAAISGDNILASKITSIATPDATIGNAIEFHTIPASSAAVAITSTNAVDAIIEIQDDIGEITSLGTTDKSDIVSSINEIETAVRGSTGNYTLDTAANDVVAAINEIENVFDASTHEISAGSNAFNITSGELTIDSSADIILDADGGDLRLKDAGVQYASLTNSSGNIVLQSGSTTMLTGSGANATFAGNVDATGIVSGSSYKVGSTVIVDTSRNLTNIGTITSGAITSSGNLDLNASADISANLVVGGTTQVTGTFNVDSTTTLNGTTIDGALDLNGAADISTNLVVHGNTTFGDNAAADAHVYNGTLTIGTLDTSSQNVRGSINELHTQIGSALIGGSGTAAAGLTNLTSQINALDAEIGVVASYEGGAYGSTTISGVLQSLQAGLIANDGEIASNDTDIAARLIKSSGSSQALATNLSFGGNKTYTVTSGSTLAIASGATLTIAGSASGVSTFGTSFLEVDGNQTSTPMGFAVNRSHIGSAPTPYPAIQWREGVVASKPHRSWQIVGLNDAGNSSQEQDIVTFFNAKDLFANNTETGLAVTWQADTQNFDVVLGNSVFTLTGAVTGSVTQTAKGNVTIATTATSDPTLTLTGDASGSATFTNLGNASLNVVIANDSHNHDHSDANFTVGGNLQVNGNTVLGNQTTDTTTIAGGLTVAGNLTVNGTNTILNTTTLEVEDTLVLVGSNAGNSAEPSTGGFGLETRLFSGLANAVINGRTWSSTGKHPNAASDVSGSHSLVYNFTSDRWEADGSLVLSEATLASPGLEVNGTDIGTLTGSKTLDLKAGTGIGLAAVVNGNEFEVTINNTLAGYSGWFLSTQGTNRGNIADDERVDFHGGTALTATYDTTNTNRVIFSHDNVGPGAQVFGQPSTEDGTYIKSVTINAQGHITAVTSDDFDNRYVQENETSQSAVTANKVVRTSNSGTISATAFAGPLTGNVTGNVSGNVTGSAGSSTGNSASASQVYVTEANGDTTFRRLVWHTGDGSGNKDLHHDDSLTYQASSNTLSVANITSTLSGNASSATTSGQVTINYNNNSNANYQMLWGSGNYVYGTAGVVVNPYTNTITATTFSGNLSGNVTGNVSGNVSGTSGSTTGNAASVTNGVYTTGNQTINGTKTFSSTISGSINGSSASTTGNAATITSQANSATITAEVHESASTIVRRDGSGYINNNYFNMSANQVSSGISRMAVETGSDNFLRWGTSAAVRTFLNVANGANAYVLPFNYGSANSGNYVVQRDGSGNFSAGTITATLSGNITGNAATATNIRVVQRTTENVNYHILAVGADIAGTNKQVQGHASFYWNGNAARLYAPNITAALASCTGYAYGNLTGTPTIPTNNNQLTNGNGYTTFAGNTYSNAMNQHVRTSDTVQFGLVRSTGDIVAYYSSDERLKDNVQVIDGALEKVSKLRGVEFDWNDKQDVYEGHDIGVIAQDVEAVAPELVQTRDDGYKAVKYEKLTALLIEAVKELKDENKQIRIELENLKSINS